MKVLVGIPSLRENDRFSLYRDSVISAAKQSLGNITYEIFVTPPTKDLGDAGIVNAQNFLAEKCLREGWDYLWLIDGDVQVTLDAFKKLYALDVDLACGYYPYHHDYDKVICGFLDGNMKVWHLPREAIRGHILTGWVFAATGCLLIKRRVFEAGVPFKHRLGVGQDILFMFNAQKAGFTAIVHGDVECGHLPEWPLLEKHHHSKRD